MAFDLTESARRYFDAFSRHDLAALGAMFAETVSLTDWDIQRSGKVAVLEANKGIFDACPAIKVEFVRAYTSGSSVSSEIIVHVDANTSFSVVDVLDFGADGLITAVRAYKGA